jgi:hypothetical protein
MRGEPEKESSELDSELQPPDGDSATITNPPKFFIHIIPNHYACTEEIECAKWRSQHKDKATKGSRHKKSQQGRRRKESTSASRKL